MTLQRSLDNTARRLSVCTPITATSDLLKITLVPGFHLNFRNNLCTGLHQFGLGQNTSSAQKVLKARSNQKQVIAGGATAPSLDGIATLTAPDRVSLPATLAMTWGDHSQLRVCLVYLFEPDHPTALAMRGVNTEIMERDT